MLKEQKLCNHLWHNTSISNMPIFCFYVFSLHICLVLLFTDQVSEDENRLFAWMLAEKWIPHATIFLIHLLGQALQAALNPNENKRVEIWDSSTNRSLGCWVTHRIFQALIGLCIVTLVCVICFPVSICNLFPRNLDGKQRSKLHVGKNLHEQMDMESL